MSNTIFDRPDLSAFTRLDGLGLEVTGQRIWPDHAVLACRITGADRWCRRCGCQGESRDTVVRRLAHEPCGWRPTILHVSVRRYRCPECAHVWRQNMSQAADPRAKLSHSAVRWALMGLVVHHLTVARISQALGVSWNTANTAVLGEGQRLLINDPARFDGVRVIGVDEHVWRHTPYGDKYVTVILDLTPIRDRRGPCRLLDMVPGRSKQVFKTWLALPSPIRGVSVSRSSRWMDSPGLRAPPLKNSQTRGRSWIPSTSCTWLATPWMSAADAFSKNSTIGAGVPWIPCTRPAGCLRTRSCLLTPRQQHQLLDLFASQEHVALEVTWSAYQNIIDSYRVSNTRAGKAMMEAGINTLTCTRVPRGLTELITLGRTLKCRAGDILAYFDHPHTSNGPTEAINGRLEYLRGSALGFRNLTHYITRCLLETGGFRPQLHPQL